MIVMDRKKELISQYKQMRPPMGIFIVRSQVNDKCYIEVTQNLRASINGTKFKLGAGNHINRELQKEWKEFGEDHFTIEILENLEYDKDESKTDYREDLAILKMIWEEKLADKNTYFYKK